MENRYRPTTRFWLLCAACVVAFGGFGCCSCDDCPDPEPGIGAADHWVVIHDFVKFTGGIAGAPNTCANPDTGETVAYLPKCLTVEKGQKIGFYNFTKKTITVEHFNSLSAPTTFDIAPGMKEVFTVVVEGTVVQINFKTTLDHGGPEMIVEP